MFSDRIQGVTFSAHTSDEIRALAIKRITNSETYDQLLHPNPNGLYDPALGANDNDDRCDTCGYNSMKCPGHFGYIELPLPVYHPMFFKLMIQILRGSCFNCHRLTAKSSRTHLFARQCDLLDRGFLIEASNLLDMYGSFAVDASGGSASEITLQNTIVEKIDNYFNGVYNQCLSEKIEITKNLVGHKQKVIKEYLSVHLKTKTKECPHCKSMLRDIRQEYNVRIYFKSASQKAVKKAVSEKMAPGTPSTSKKSVKREQSENTDESMLDAPTDNANSDLFDGADDAEQEEEEEVETKEHLKKKLSAQEYITPDEVKRHLIQLWNIEGKALKHLLGSYNEPKKAKRVTTPEIFFLDVVAVPPSKFRPLSYMGEKRFENPQTANLNKILLFSRLVEEILKRIEADEPAEAFIPVVLTSAVKSYKMGSKPTTVPGKSYNDQLQNAWVELQQNVNAFMDSSLSKLTADSIPGIRQLLEKKEGLFRKHMMGKRVNYACRSVISPDPYINTDEIGIPLIFASKLTYVQPVTSWNLEQLRKMVINGPNKYPGAVMIEYEDGRKTMLSDDEAQRRAVAKQLLSSPVAETSDKNERVLQGKKVHRHLINGDVLLLNRQPSLHKCSIMAHKARVLPNERTLRLHYANCNSYNADFDGDEMNAHFPQNELGRAEAYNLVSTNCNYLGPKDGKPLAGLIQDHVISGVTMTSRGTFYNRFEYQKLVYSGLIDVPGRVKTLPPCIMKPAPLWSGKQVFSTILLNTIPEGKIPLNMNGKPKVSDDEWPKGKGRAHTDSYASAYANDPFLTEAEVIVRGGELMTGILDKSQYGAVSFSLVHCVYELYGGVVSGKLLSTLARLFTAYLQQQHGFTLGIQDILVLPPAEEKRCDIIREGRLCGDESAAEALNVTSDKDALFSKLQEAQFTNHGLALAQLDLSMKSRTDAINNKVNSVCIKGLLRKFPDNSLQLMARTGAKGSSVNCMQISCLLGQIELEGRRPPLSMSGRSLPSFIPYDTSPRAGGFVDQRFLTGIKPQEYFFHCMAGREGLIDTAVKTSRSGYLQRCLMKHLEGLIVQYDMTVRDGDGSVVQFLYGDDGMDVLKSQFMQKDQYKSIVQNYNGYVALSKPGEIGNIVDVSKAPKMQRKRDRWMKKKGDKVYSSVYSHNQLSPFTLFEKNNRKEIEKEFPSTERKLGRTEADRNLMERWRESDGPTKEHYISKCQPCPDPVLSKYHPACYFGSVPDKFKNDVQEYIDKNPDNLCTDDDTGKEKNKVRGDTFLPLMLIKFMRSLVSPGEPVGCLAGQSIGEPSTQMTLNTFHFAGRGEMNVTLGIPRLREILMTASANIKTPQMDILVRSGEEVKAKSIARNLNKVTLMSVLKHIGIWESLQRSYTDNITRCRQFKIRLEFLPKESYEEDFNVTPEDIITYVETHFIKGVASAVNRIIRAKEKARLLETRADDTPVARSRNSEGNENPEVAPEEADDRADLSDDDAGDGDVMDVQDRNKKTQFTSYDDPDEQEEEQEEDNLDIGAIKREPQDQDDMDMTEHYLEETSMPLPEVATPTIEKKQPIIHNKGEAAAQEDPRIANVLRRERHLTNYVVDVDNQWCEFCLQFPLAGSKVMLLSVIEKVAMKAVVHEASGITKAMTCDSKAPGENGRARLKTEGINMPELWKYPDILDLNTLYCNNIHTVAKRYGIEAARRVVIKEIEDVFKAYGIYINARHLSLLADYMTFEGSYKPFNRIGIESNASPFQKISFETGMSFLRSATAFGQPDDLGSPSSRIVVGRVIGQGTGLIDLKPKLSI